MSNTPYAAAENRIRDAETQGLKSLDLAGLGLTRLPRVIAQLTQLEQLYLQGNKLASLPSSLGGLTKLRTLNLASNRLKGLPESVFGLSELQDLNLADNMLSEVPDGVGRLTRLEHLTLAHNRLSELPVFLRQLTSLKSLHLHGNPALHLPAEVLGPTWQEFELGRVSPTPTSEILEYYFRMRGDSRPLNEAKLIVLGRGAVGKTSLINRLIHARFEGERRTEGIRITEWPIKVGRKKEDVRLHIWDFGGQEIMHATHQFFLTERCLYMIVLSGREGVEDADAEYWLKLIQSFGGDSPVIIVLNKIKEHPFDVNRNALLRKYPFIREFVKTDCEDATGIKELRRVVERETDNLEHLRDAFPSSWFSIKEAVAGMERNFLSFDEFRALCARLGETVLHEQEVLASYLHDLGLVLNYNDDPRLRDTFIVNPRWVTSGIYKILNASRLERQRGEISLKDLHPILDAKEYPTKMHGVLLELMKKFELCFGLEGSEGVYLIPELLDKQQPDEADEFDPAACLNFQYQYPILPEGLLPRFIVRTYVLSDETRRWRTGVILRLEENLALVRADMQERRVFINIKGPVAGRRRLLSVIRANFDHIHDSIRNLKPAEMVSLPGHPSHLILYDELLALEMRGKEEFEKVIDGELVTLSVQDLLGGVKGEDGRGRGRSRGARVFVTYSRKDERMFNELRTHLSPLQRLKLVDLWDDQAVEAGGWRVRVNENLERSDIIILLVSADFIASGYCDGIEMARALELHEKGEARVVPVIVRDVHWTVIPQLSKIQVLPRDGRPVSRWRPKDRAWLDVSERIRTIIEAMRLQSGFDARPEDGKARADEAEKSARGLLAGLDYGAAAERVAAAIAADSERAERLRDEFGFILNLDDEEARRESEPGGLRWRARVWRVLSERNNFEPPPLSEQPAQLDAQTDASRDEDESKPAVRAQDSSSSEERGEMLEQAVVRLFEEFFQLGDGKDEVLETLRKQRRGTQFGYDIGFDCVLGWNNKIRCRVECKNLSKEVTLKDISDKLHSQNHFDRHIDIWVLVSPRADVSNELAEVLEGWKRDPLYPFEIQVWTPSTGTAEFFGLVPEVYEAFFEAGDSSSGPRHWDNGKRAEVRERWRRKLKPPLRLPEGWERYLREPFRLCLRRENVAALDATYASHVTMMCRHAGGAPMPLPLEDYVREWLAQPDKPVFFLLGEFGDGKSFFTYSLARRLASEFRESPEAGWIPLRLALRDFFETGNVRDFLRRRLEELGATLEGWTTLRATRRLLVILDGFDEMSKRLDPATVTRNINALIECYEEFEGCKVLITSRTHFFERRQEERRLMSRLDEPLVYTLARITRRTTEREIETTAERMGIPQVMAKLRSLHDPIGLAAKPLFLQMLKDMLHDLPDDLDEVTLYEKYVRNSLKRKADQLDDMELKTDREELLRKLTSLLEAIAVKLQTSEQEYVSLSKFSRERHEGFAELLWKMTGPEDEDDARARVGVRSLLSRVDLPNMEEEWPVDFFHRSIREYFVARSLCSAVKGGAGESFLKDVPLNHEILDFAAAQMRKTRGERWDEALLHLVGLATPGREPGRLGGAALTLLHRLDPALPAADWTGKVFDYADLEGADLSGRSFRRSSFRHADLTNVNFENADFGECDLTGVRIEETTAVVSLSAFPSGDRLLVTYSDGTARAWDIRHPRKSESRIVASQLPVEQGAVGILSDVRAWGRSPGAFTFMGLGRDELRSEVRFPVKSSYRLASPTETDLLVVEDGAGGSERVLVIDLERQGVAGALKARSVTLCAPLGREAVALSDASGGLRVVGLNVKDGRDEVSVASGVVTCLSSLRVGERQHLIAWGEDDGTTQVWAVDLRGKECTVRKLLAHQPHVGHVTAVTFLDDTRVASGGQDRVIVIARFDDHRDSPSGLIERKLQLTLLCRGMRIEGLKGPDEQRKLGALIAKSSQAIVS
jgi:internalin A